MANNIEFGTSNSKRIKTEHSQQLPRPIGEQLEVPTYISNRFYLEDDRLNGLMASDDLWNMVLSSLHNYDPHTQIPGPSGLHNHVQSSEVGNNIHYTQVNVTQQPIINNSTQGTPYAFPSTSYPKLRVLDPTSLNNLCGTSNTSGMQYMATGNGSRPVRSSTQEINYSRALGIASGTGIRANNMETTHNTSSPHLANTANMVTTNLPQIRPSSSAYYPYVNGTMVNPATPVISREYFRPPLLEQQPIPTRTTHVISHYDSHSNPPVIRLLRTPVEVSDQPVNDIPIQPTQFINETRIGPAAAPYINVQEHLPEPTMCSVRCERPPGIRRLPQNASTSDKHHKLVQQKLVMLLHARRCQRHQSSTNATSFCQVPLCDMTKKILNHMTACNTLQNCAFSHCSSSRALLYHWKICVLNDCPICSPIKIKQDAQRKRESPDYNMDSVLKLMECPVCFEIMSSRIRQCKEGHSLCDKCTVQLQACPTCRSPMLKSIRNYQLEGVINTFLNATTYFLEQKFVTAKTEPLEIE